MKYRVQYNFKNDNMRYELVGHEGLKKTELISIFEDDLKRDYNAYMKNGALYEIGTDEFIGSYAVVKDSEILGPDEVDEKLEY